MPDIYQLGFTKELETVVSKRGIEQSSVARVIREHKELYVVQNEEGIFNAEITGNMRFAASSRSDFPAVGDWVQVLAFEEHRAIIQQILLRKGVLERQAVGTYSEKQIIGANIDTALIVQGADRDFNLNRLERYLVIARNAGLETVVILNKRDLVSKDELAQLRKQILHRVGHTHFFATNAISGEGLLELEKFLEPHKTYCCIGSSGVGKSSILNFLSGKSNLETAHISDSTGKGRHTTSHRELLLLENGSILIDTPGMREIGITEKKQGLEATFDVIAKLAEECKFTNCTHVDEPGCKVLESVENGIVSIEELENYKKLLRQTDHFSASVAEKRRRDKALGKMYKEVLKNKKGK